MKQCQVIWLNNLPLFSTLLCCFGNLYAPCIPSHVLVLVPVKLQACSSSASTIGDLNWPLCLQWSSNSALTDIRYLRVNIYCGKHINPPTSVSERLTLKLRNGPQISDAIQSMRHPCCGGSHFDHDIIDDIRKASHFLLPPRRKCHRTVWYNAYYVLVTPRFVMLTCAAMSVDTAYIYHAEY